MKRQLMAAYGMADTPLSAVELDHLAPLSLSGATDQANLWPQPWDQARKKDVLENRLHPLVCLDPAFSRHRRAGHHVRVGGRIQQVRCLSSATSVTVAVARDGSARCQAGCAIVPTHE